MVIAFMMPILDASISPASVTVLLVKYDPVIFYIVTDCFNAELIS